LRRPHQAACPGDREAHQGAGQARAFPSDEHSLAIEFSAFQQSKRVGNSPIAFVVVGNSLQNQPKRGRQLVPLRGIDGEWNSHGDWSFFKRRTATTLAILS
jgi:hypothetical protein